MDKELKARYEAAPMMVKRRHLLGDTGYSVTALEYEVGFYPTVKEARARVKELANKPSAWMGGKVCPMFIYDVKTVKQVLTA